MKAIPEKFEELEHDQIMFFAKRGFEMFQALRKSVEKSLSPNINSTTQNLSDAEKDFIRQENKNNRSIIDAITGVKQKSDKV